MCLDFVEKKSVSGCDGRTVPVHLVFEFENLPWGRISQGLLGELPVSRDKVSKLDSFEPPHVKAPRTKNHFLLKLDREKEEKRHRRVELKRQLLPFLSLTEKRREKRHRRVRV